MGKRKSKKYNDGVDINNFKNIFGNLKNNWFRNSGFRGNRYKNYNPFNIGRRSCNDSCWLTPAKCLVSGIIVVTLLFYGVGLYGLIIIALLIILLQFV